MQDTYGNQEIITPLRTNTKFSSFYSEYHFNLLILLNKIETRTKKQYAYSYMTNPNDTMKALFFYNKEHTKKAYKNFIFLCNYFSIWYFNKFKKPHNADISELIESSNLTKKHICSRIEKIYKNSLLYDEGHYYTGDPVINKKKDLLIKEYILTLIELNKMMGISNEDFYED